MMMFPEPRVEGTPGGVEAPEPAMPAKGVPAQAPVPAPVDVPAQPVDAEAEWNTRLAKEREQWEHRSKRDMDKLRSTLDSRRARDLDERDRAIRDLQERQESDLLSRMTAEERSAYEQESSRERVRTLQEEVDRERQARQTVLSMMNYAQRLTDMGVNVKGLNFNDPDNFFPDADAKFEEYLRDLQARAQSASVAPPANPAAPVVPGRPVPPQVVTSTGTPPAQLTPDQAFEALRKLATDKAGRPVSEEEIWRMAETGQLDLNQHIPGLS